MSLITFDVNKKAQQSLGKSLQKKIKDLPTLFKSRGVEGIEACGATNTDLLDQYRSNANPLVLAGYTAYQAHYPLTLSPDSMWLTIANSFAMHVNENAETLRKRFIDHESKVLIKLYRDGFIKGSPDNDWVGCFDEFSDKISGFIGKKRDMIVSDFSTTTAIDKAASEVVLMDSMKSYFKYGMSTRCGIPNITLEGTVADWKKVRDKAYALSEFDCGWWIDKLGPNLDKIVSTAEGNPDIHFWDEFFKVDGGSGGPYVNGWIGTLFPYLKTQKVYKNPYLEAKDRWGGPKLDEFPSGLASVPFKWEIGDTNTTHDMEFVGGLVGVSQDTNTLSLKTESCWAVKDTGVSKEGMIDENENW